MANTYVNKVQLADGTSLIDISDSTVTADKLMQGYTAHDRTGALITGTATGGNVWQDAQGRVHLDDEGTPPITVEALNVTQNGTYTATTGHAYSPVTVNVSGGGGGLEYETGTWTPTDDVENHDILFTNQHNTAPFYYSIILDITTYDTATYTMYSLIYVDWYTLLGAIHYSNTTSSRYGSIDRKYKGSSSTVLSTGNAYLTTSTSSDSFCTNEKIVASGNGNFWKAGYTYKWLAIWRPTT